MIGYHAMGQSGRLVFATALFLLAALVYAQPHASVGLPDGKASGDSATEGDQGGAELADEFIVIGFNDLGMHCMDADYSTMSILPPFNTFRAQVIKRGNGPDIITEDEFTLEYFVPSNTRSADKTNFWQHAPDLFGVNLEPDVGLFGKALSGTMEIAPQGIYEAIGIPLVPEDDSGLLNPYPLATIRVLREGVEVASTQAVMPVSRELNCSLCHVDDNVAPEVDILRDHDRLHGTDLEQNQPVLCASCHEDVALGAPGLPDLPPLSTAVHGAHADRVDVLEIENACYACHPGVRTQCQRDIHLARGVTCDACHGGMAEVGDPGRSPWVDEPRCSDCHDRPGFRFEETGKLYKDSRGHGGVRCATCHGSPHAITPTLTGADNQQAIRLQGHAGVINDCLVCHGQMPDEPFFHQIED